MVHFLFTGRLCVQMPQLTGKYRHFFGAHLFTDETHEEVVDDFVNGSWLVRVLHTETGKSLG